VALSSGAGPWGSILDVPGVAVGQSQRLGAGWLSGVTVVVPPPGTVGGVDVRGGGPGTHETDALDPTTLVPTVDAVALTGGSAFGLVAAHGVQHRLVERGRGFEVPARTPGRDSATVVVPIVPAAAVFDLGRGGDPGLHPDVDLGYAAVLAAESGPAVQRGVAGAGTGALLAGTAVKGGTGTASVLLPALGVTVGALAVVNAFGSPADAVTGTLLGTAFVPPGRARPSTPPPDQAAAWRAALAAVEPAGPAPGTATTLVVVVTDAALDPAMTRRMATAAHAGLARALDPSHTLVDGDTAFALATGAIPLPPPGRLAVHAAAATAVTLAIMDAVLAATATRTVAVDVPAYLDLCPGGAPG
jgi:L-aminopeptidase/D-esterase-like protein